MSREQIDIIFLLDRSGSMYGCENDTIGGFNSFIEKEKVIEKIRGQAWDEIGKFPSIYVPDYNEAYNDNDVVIEIADYSISDNNINANLDNGEYKKRNKKECPIEHFKIVVETEKPYKIYGGEAGSLIEHREYRVSVRRLCMILCLAAESYYNKNKDKFTFFNYSILDWDKYIDSLPKDDRNMMLEEALKEIW